MNPKTDDYRAHSYLYRAKPIPAQVDEDNRLEINILLDDNAARLVNERGRVMVSVWIEPVDESEDK